MRTVRLSRREARRLDDVDLATLGGRIREARRAAGLTQRDIAGDAFQAAYLSRIESGDRKPSPRVLAHIAAACGVEAASLLVDDASEDPDELARLVAQRTAAWLRKPRDAGAYAAMASAVDAWETSTRTS